MYVIVKFVRQQSSEVKLPVILLDNHGEVMEFETEEQAEEMRTLFELNSDSGHKYQVKKI
jgi:hypothetical protein